MTKSGLEFARAFGVHLPAFRSQSEAEQALFGYRDARLDRIQQLSGFVTDFSADSLKAMEQWYFDLVDADGFKSWGTSREEVEECMAIYFGEVLVRNIEGAKWFVTEYAFVPGKYEIGVRHGLQSIMLQRFKDHFATPKNKRHQSIWRRYMQQT